MKARYIGELKLDPASAPIDTTYLVGLLEKPGSEIVTIESGDRILIWRNLDF